MHTLQYLSRCLFYNVPAIDDYRHFPAAPVCRHNSPVLHFAAAHDNSIGQQVQWTYRGQPQYGALQPLLQHTGTTACIVMQHQKILLETYLNGYDRHSINTSFSIAKSMTSALIGIALEAGHIHSIHDPVARYIPAFGSHGRDTVTIAHLLQMCSGLRYREGVMPWSDDALIYYGTHLKEQALKSRLAEPPGSTYHYNNYNLLLLGMILETTTGQSVARLFQDQIWQRIGAEADASWSMDSRQSGYCKMESGINALAMDFVRFGNLYLQQGQVGQQQVVPPAWIAASVSPPAFQADSRKYLSRLSPPLCKWTSSAKGYYKYLWWGYQTDTRNFDYFALGAKGQLLYISPRKQAVIVRFGKQWGKIDWWPDLLKQIADSLD
ncbi:serine hydrolase domain-containing protein [Chitinophaga nivalis]|uniref:Beta-lactamase family protein n=1 Tax=Chitinophaga nivalis TaxID=2991709 RepID=A0ABT3ISQ2_9BACT|nr:serine hydrolase [Chitinophaga nivalis]MCW3463307.1 beta-lactamase family protein [Chitinophaga nivalis]MCW3487003.1 beta-lactamase family protein [Chitinophaga nivalis]